MRYTPSPTPETGLPARVRAWLSAELRRIAGAIAVAEQVTLPALGEEPEKIKNGMIVYADGVSWDPGSGAGFYGREAGAWVKL